MDMGEYGGMGESGFNVEIHSNVMVNRNQINFQKETPFSTSKKFENSIILFRLFLPKYVNIFVFIHICRLCAVYIIINRFYV